MIGRLIGWLLLSTAFLTASAEAVMALGAGSYTGIATAEVLTLLAGTAPEVPVVPADAGDSLTGLWAGLTVQVLDLPAWVAMGALGFGFLVVFRRRRHRTLFRRSSFS